MSTKRKRSPIWNYFDPVEGETNVASSVCGEKLKTSGNTTNLLKHLRLKHDSEFRLVAEEQSEAKISKRQEKGKQMSITESKARIYTLPESY